MESKRRTDYECEDYGRLWWQEIKVTKWLDRSSSTHRRQKQVRHGNSGGYDDLGGLLFLFMCNSVFPFGPRQRLELANIGHLMYLRRKCNPWVHRKIFGDTEPKSNEKWVQLFLGSGPCKQLWIRCVFLKCVVQSTQCSDDMCRKYHVIYIKKSYWKMLCFLKKGEDFNSNLSFFASWV